MPEGPEHHLAARSINTVAADRVFGGNIERSDVVITTGNSKHPDVPWNCPAYMIVACARGKEVKLTLSPISDGGSVGKRKAVRGGCLEVYFQFGMSGYFQFTASNDIPKHSHLRFRTCDDGESMVLSFVDPRRFGKWRSGGEWNADRGPDPLFEYLEFRESVMKNLDKSAFNHAICEALLNQQYFNGIGNYLRAEILFRANVRPFDCARDVLSELPIDDDLSVKSENQDVLRLCHIVGNDVLSLYKSETCDPLSENYYGQLKTYLKCYGRPDMNNLTDSHARTIWFKGQPGKLVPAKAKQIQRHANKRNRKINVVDDDKGNIPASEKILKPKKLMTAKSVKPVPKNYCGPTTRSKTISLKT